MDIRKLQHIVIDALEDVKAQDIRAFNTTGLTDLFDRVFIASGTSNRHTKSLAASVRDKVKAAGGVIISVEGEATGEWVLVDLGDAVVHIMQPAIRAYYNLEELWGSKPVALQPRPARKRVTPQSSGGTSSSPKTSARAAAKVATKRRAPRATKARKAV